MKILLVSTILSGLALALPAHVELKEAIAELKFGEWTYCGDAAKDAYTVQDVTVSQYMGIASINVFGQVNRDIKQGSQLLSALTLGKYPISVQKVDFCEFLEHQPLAPKCPLKKGKLDMTLQLSIPPNMPPSEYILHSIIQDSEDSPIACLKGAFSVPAF